MTREHLAWYNFDKHVEIKPRDKVREIKQRKAEKGQVKNEAVVHVE